jgi:hypothetical protein
LWVVDGRVRLLKETEKSPKQQNMENPPHTHKRGFYSFFSCGVKTHEEKGKIETKTHGGGCTRRKKKEKRDAGGIVFQHKSWAQPFFHILFEELSQTTSLPPPNSWKNSTTLASLHELSDRQRDSPMAFLMIPA